MSRNIRNCFASPLTVTVYHNDVRRVSDVISCLGPPCISPGSALNVSVDLGVMGPFLCLFLALWGPQFCVAQPVVQIPRSLVVRPGGDVTIECQHNDSSKLSKYWYQQEGGKALVLMGYTYTTSTIEMEKEFSEGRFTITPKSTQHSVLTISGVSAQDSATYYCASSTHSDTGRGRHCAELTPPDPSSLHTLLPLHPHIHDPQ
ncbi:T cell receptor beta variable 20-1 [Xenopus laevis]|uniref:T cell receptor beta variable 20-1 n=1 Tax=Xenopus laevis TaxID=8355 RepID=UPI001BB19180|nr:T cell receptor beta variable 20-1 [Xenopus laevis]